MFSLLNRTGIIQDANDSLFVYSEGDSWSTYYDPSFVPVYEANFSDPDLEQDAVALCGSDLFCLFDVAVTGNMDIGLSTLEGSLNFEILVEMAAPGKNSQSEYILYFGVNQLTIV